MQRPWRHKEPVGLNEKRIILHIGTHKTGTSSFQRSLMANAETLIARGVRPMQEEVLHSAKRQHRTNVSGIAHLFIRPALRTVARINGSVEDLTPSQTAERRDRLAQRLKEITEPLVIVSSESFCFLRSAEEQAQLRRMLEQVGRWVETLVVFRDDASWRTSWQNQLQKRPEVSAQIALGQEDGLLEDWYFDKAAIRHFWSPFGLREIDYGASENIVETLYQAMNVPCDGILTEFNVNRSKPL